MAINKSPPPFTCDLYGKIGHLSNNCQEGNPLSLEIKEPTFMVILIGNNTILTLMLTILAKKIIQTSLGVIGKIIFDLNNNKLLVLMDLKESLVFKKL